jgi:negative regulator of flagellin synthesis FlgM
MTQTSGIGNSQLSSNLIDRTDRMQTEKQLKASSVQRPDTTTRQDVATVSGTGSVLATAATNTEDVRTERVAALKAAVDAGSYNVSSTAVADKLLDSMLE